MEHRFSIFFKDKFDTVTPESRAKHLRKHIKLLVWEVIGIVYIFVLIFQYHYKFGKKPNSRSEYTPYVFADEFNFDDEGCLEWEYAAACNKVYDKLITNWMIVASGFGGFVLLRRWTIIGLWFCKRDPHKQEMIINALFFVTFLLFEVVWHIFLNTFVWYYIFHTFDKYEVWSQLLLFPVLGLGYLNIAIYLAILFFVVILVGGGWITGYWNFSKKKASDYNQVIEEREKRKETLKLNNIDKNRLKEITGSDTLEEEPTFANGILDFRVDGKKIVIYK